MNEYIVSAEQEGTRLDVFLTEQMEGSRSYIQTLIKGGHVTVGGKVGKANLRLTPNMVIQVEIPEPESVEVTPEDIPLDVLYEDHDIIIVNKARGMVVHPAVGNYSGTLVNALLFHCKDLSGINGEIRPGIVHRLDKDTSGVMMAAKKDAAHIGLAEQVKEQSAKECNLETGRTHQIRVHFAHIGHPVVNDPFYGYRRMDFPIEGQALHSRSLDVKHPITGEDMHFEAPVPADFEACLEFAKTYREDKRK